MAPCLRENPKERTRRYTEAGDPGVPGGLVVCSRLRTRLMVEFHILLVGDILSVNRLFFLESRSERIAMSAEARVAELKLEFPPAPKPGGVYHPVVVVGNLAYVSGHGPMRTDGSMITGKVGATMNEVDAHQAARQVGLTMLATLRRELGSLDRIQRLVKTLGMVNSTPDFGTHPQVINGFSNLMVEIWGETNGKGARSAVGMGSLPGNIAVEVEAIFELKPANEA